MPLVTSAQDAAGSVGAEEEFSLDDVLEDPTAEDAKTPSIIDHLGENLRFNLDVVSRVMWNHRRDETGALNAVGFDIHKVWSSESGDIGTFVLQPYVVRRDNALHIMTHVEDDDDWEVEFHQFYFNYTQLAKGRLNVKVGHLLIPYGLEPYTDTHLTLYQVLSMQNLGMKMDWGFSLNGSLQHFDYEVALTRGSGMELTHHRDNFALSGRIGTPTDQNFVAGASFFYGQVMDPHRLARWREGIRPPTRVEQARRRIPGTERDDEDLVRRIRAGLDMTWIIEQFTLRGEASVGLDYEQDVLNSLLELGWTSADQKLYSYIQGVYLGQRGSLGWDDDTMIRVGARWQIAEHLSVSGIYIQELASYMNRPRNATFAIQLRLIL